jgi:hypothetical protein
MRTSITYLGTRACRLRSASVTSIGSLPGAGAEDAAWREEYARAHDEDEFDQFRMSQFVSSKFSRMVHDLELQRQIELEDRDPLNTMRMWRGAEYKLVDLSWRSEQELYRAHLDSPRWQRIRTRKLVSVNWCCEYPGCNSDASECHHLHYDNVGLETNADLEALCRYHHLMRHGRAL